MTASLSGDFDLAVLGDPGAIDRFVPEWKGLAERVPDLSPLLTPEVLLSWWEGYGDDLDPHVVVLVHRGTAVGVLPMARQGRRLVGWCNEYSDRFGPLVDAAHPEAAELMAVHLAGLRGWSLLDLRHLDEEVSASRSLIRALAAEGLPMRIRRSLSSPWIELPSAWDDLDARLSRSFRKSLRRKVNAADRSGLVATITDEPSGLRHALDIAGESWAAEEGTAISSTPQSRRFIEALTERTAAAGWLRIALLWDGDRAIAFEINLLRGQEAVNLKVGYRGSAAGGSPGLVLRHAVLRDLITAGAATFDLLGAAEAYKLHWTDRVRHHVRVQGYPPTTAGRIRHAVRHRLGSTGRRLLRRGL